MRRKYMRRPLFARRTSARRPKGRRRFPVVLLLCLVLLFIVYFWADAKIKPLVTQMAMARVHTLATETVNDTVTEIFSGEDIQYDDLVYFEKDLTGKITALKTDMIKINRIKARITQNVLNKLENTDTSELGIPLGNVINGEILSGRGPRIPVRIVPVGTVDASFHDSLTAAGINQTRHQIMLTIRVNIGVLLPGVTQETVVEVQVNVAETIIVGDVPDSYVNFDGGKRLSP